MEVQRIYRTRAGASRPQAPDGNEIYFAGDDGHSWRIYSQDLAKDEIRPLTPSILVDPITVMYGLVASIRDSDIKQMACGAGNIVADEQQCCLVTPKNPPP